MKIQTKTFFLGLLLLLSTPSCMVTKCRYSNGWNISLNKGLDYPNKTLTKNSNKTSLKANPSSQLASIDTSFFVASNSNTVFLADVNAGYVVDLNSTITPSQLDFKTHVDSSKNNQKTKKKSHRRYRSQYYDFIPNSDFDYFLLLLLLGFIIAVLVVWAIFSLIRLLVRAIRGSSSSRFNTATRSPNAYPASKALGSETKINQTQAAVNFERVSNDSKTDQKPENKEEETEIEEENKSKLLSFIGAVLGAIGLASLMAIGMRNQ